MLMGVAHPTQGVWLIPLRGMAYPFQGRGLSHSGVWLILFRGVAHPTQGCGLSHSRARVWGTHLLLLSTMFSKLMLLGTLPLFFSLLGVTLSLCSITTGRGAGG